MGLEIIRLEHNSPEWLNYRRTGIGGSDAAAILGLSPFKTNVEVWEEKVGLREPKDISDNPAVKYGKEAEDIRRQLFALDYPELEVTADKTVVYRRGFMFASLDGDLKKKDTGELGIYEGKTTELHRRADLMKWTGRVPDYYYVQLLHYFITTERAFSILDAQIKLDVASEIEILVRRYPYYRKDLFPDLRYLYTEEKDFWGYVERKERPPLKLPRFNRTEF